MYQRAVVANTTSHDHDLVRSVQEAHIKLQRCLDSMNKVLIGQEDVNKLVLTNILAGGNVMLTGKPGLGKTELTSNLAEILGLSFSRIQGVSDLMPSDITGSEHYDEHSKKFEFEEGPIFKLFVMFDEINRAPPRTQSALLQAMQEKSVTVRGEMRQLERPFHVVATRNPIEQEGTYPLPEAQMDRFLMDINIYNTTAENEWKIVEKMLNGEKTEKAKQIISKEELIELQQLVRKMPIGDQVKRGAINMVRACRPDDPKAHKSISEGVLIDPSGSRAQYAFIVASNALAMIEGRYTSNTSDLKTLSQPILAHRIGLSFAARSRGEKVENLIDQVCERELGL